MLTYVVIGLLLTIVIVISGDDVARHIGDIEKWIAKLGPWGLVAFVLLFVVATSLMMPETALSIMAGALFGLTWGFAAVVAGSLLAAMLQYALSRRLLHGLIDKALTSRPSMAAIQRAVLRDELKLQTLLRLTPLNPATTSYMLGAAGVKFPGFLLACLALIPSALIEVYFGFAGRHVAHIAGRSNKEIYTHDLMIFGGLALTIVILVLVAKTAHKAVMRAVAEAALASGKVT